jgi:branched-chain amino acid transport system permease protein
MSQSDSVAKPTALTRFFNGWGLSPLGLGAVILALGLIPFIENQFYLRLLTTALMYGALAMAFDFTGGFIGIVDFGFAAFWGLGAYTSGCLAYHLGLSPWFGLAAAAASAAVLGLVLGLLTIRLGGIFAACMTWFVAMVMLTVASNWVTMTRGATGLTIPLLFKGQSNLPYLLVMLGLVALTYLILTRLVRSKAGLAFRAIGQDTEAAAISGVNANFYKVMNFTISCAFAGLIGGFYAHFVGVLTPQTLHTRATVEMMAIAYIGGRGSIWGGLLAALLIIPGLEQLKSVQALSDLMELRLMLYGALMIVVMVFYPKGLAGLWEQLVRLLKLEKVAAVPPPQD